MNQLISREIARRQRIGRQGAEKRKAHKETPRENRCNKCGVQKDEFSLTTFYDKNNHPDCRVCDDCYDHSDVRSTHFYGDGSRGRAEII